MKKVFKFVCIGLIASLGVFSAAGYAGQGGHSGGGQGKGNMMQDMGNPGKGHGHANFNSKGKDNKFVGHSGAKNQLSSSSKSKAKFSDNDRNMISKYSATHPNFSSTGGLPPGIAMNVARGKPLPPGIRRVFLPNDLTQSLAGRKNYDYLVNGKDVIVVNKKDQTVTDILSNVLH